MDWSEFNVFFVRFFEVDVDAYKYVVYDGILQNFNENQLIETKV